jgi:hypothetical protein
MAAAIAALAMAGAVSTAHATFPGENGVIVFQNPNTGMIGRVAPTGGGAIYLKKGTSPSVSPSGKKIAYVSDYNVRVMNIDGSNDVQVTSSGTSDSPILAVAWRGDGLIEFNVRSGNVNFTQQLFSMNADGTNMTATSQDSEFQNWFDFKALVAHPSANMGAFSWNEDVIARIPYFTYTFDFAWPPLVARVGGDSPSFAPEGLTVTYASYNGASASGYAYERDIFQPNVEHQLPANGATYGTNAISPDGGQIAAGVGTTTSQALQTRPRAGGGPIVQFTEQAGNVDWSRVPKNCLATTSQGGTASQPGGKASADFYASQCAIVYMPDAGQVGGYLKQAVAIGPDGRVYHSAQGSSAGAGWSSWKSPAGINAVATGMYAKKVAIAGAKDGSLQVVVVGTDDYVYHTVRYTNGSWQAGGFQPVMNGSQFFAARDVAITINADSATSQGNAQVVANGLADGSLYHIVRASDSAWSPWAMPPGAAGLNTSQLAIAAAPDGNTYVLATVLSSSGTGASVWRQQRNSNGSWDSIFRAVYTPNFVVPSTSDIAVTITPAGKAQFMYTDQNGAYLEEFANPSIWNAWMSPAANVLIAPNSTAASISAPPSGSTAASAVVVTQKSTQ